MPGRKILFSRMNFLAVTALSFLLFSGRSSIPAMSIHPGPAFAPGAFNKVYPSDGEAMYSRYITFTWEASPGATSYQICIFYENVCEEPWVDVGNVLESERYFRYYYLDVDYYWQVRAVNDTGTTAANGGWWSFHFSLPADFSKLSPVDGAAVYVPDPTLTWESSAGAWNYEYCVDTVDNEACDTYWDHRFSSSVTLEGLASNTTYYWQVRARPYEYGFGDTYANDGAWWSFHTSPPAAFIKLIPSSGNPVYVSDPTLAWMPSKGVVRYDYCIDTLNNSKCDRTWVNNALNLTVRLPATVLEPNTDYYWQVRAVGELGYTYANNSSWWTFNTSPPLAFNKDTPGDNTAVYVRDPTLTWQASTGMIRYEFCFDSLKNNTCDTAWYSAFDQDAQLNGLVANTTYWWQVRAVGDFGTIYANDNTWWSFITSLPKSFSKQSPSSGALVVSPGVLLTWQSSDGTTGYNYCIDTVDNNACDTGWQDRMLLLNAPVSSLAQDTTYYWQVRARGDFGIRYANAGIWWNFRRSSESSTYLPIVLNGAP